MKNVTKVIMTACAFACTAATANAEIVVIANPKGAASMTSEQVANVFLGKDTSMSPLDLPESNAARDEFYKKVAGKDAAQAKAIWARLIFTGKAQPPKEVGSPADAVKAVAGNDKGIAYVDKAAVDGSVKVVLTVN